MFSNFFFENLADYEIRCKNIVESDRLQAKAWRIHISRWLPKAKNTCEYVTLLFNCNSGCTNAPQCHIIHALTV